MRAELNWSHSINSSLAKFQQNCAVTIEVRVKPTVSCSFLRTDEEECKRAVYVRDASRIILAKLASRELIRSYRRATIGRYEGFAVFQSNYYHA